MTKLPKICLVVSAVTFVIGSAMWFGCISVAPAWTVVMPISAIMFGLFLITFVLEKEMTGFDADEAKKTKWIERNTTMLAPAWKPALAPVQLKEKIFPHDC